MTQRMRCWAALVLTSCGCSSVALEQKDDLPAQARAAPTPTPTASSTPGARLALGRVVEKLSFSFRCQSHNDCVVVTKVEQKGVCPPGTVIGPEQVERERRWCESFCGYTKPSGCEVVTTMLLPFCEEGTCRAHVVPTGSMHTATEHALWAVRDKLEACHTLAGERDEAPNVYSLGLGHGGLVGSVSNSRGDRAEQGSLLRCVNSALYDLEFSGAINELPDLDSRVIEVPLTFRARAGSK